MSFRTLPFASFRYTILPFSSFFRRPLFSKFPHSTSTVPFGSVTTYEECICIRLGLTKNRVLPLPEPPITRIFLFLAYFGEDGLPIVRNSVLVSITLLSASELSIYGSMSFSAPHTAEPYSSPCRNFFLFFDLM